MFQSLSKSYFIYRFYHFQILAPLNDLVLLQLFDIAGKPLNVKCVTDTAFSLHDLQTTVAASKTQAGRKKIQVLSP